MTGSDNSVTLIGGVTRDVDLTFLNNGQAAAKFGLAVDNGYKKDGEWVKKVSFFEIIAYGTLAENVANTLKKGYRTTVVGKLQQRSWENENGDKRSVVEVIADDIATSLMFVTATLTKRESVKTQSAFDSEDAF